MLYYETISDETLGLLKNIQSLDLLKDTRLVGGTALALQYCHRKSIDLDFFGNITASDEQIESLKSLIYFEDSEHDADPDLFDKHITWSLVKKQIQKAHGDYLKNLI